jgi:peptidoglycan L-alanyl-D-glutamate endopeptidase CwlK
MPQFGKTSLEKLSTCHPDLQKLFKEVIKHYDCIILEGQRSDEDQLKAFNAGKSKIKSGGKHNHSPSLAVDVVPNPLNWKDKEKFYHFIGFVKATAIQLGIKIRCGGDWDGDNDLKDQTFFDLPHFELIEK